MSTNFFLRVIPKILVVVFLTFSGQPATAGSVTQAIEEILEHHVPELEGHDWYSDMISVEEQWLFDVYQELAFYPLWVTEKGLKPEGMTLLDALLSADSHGLEPEEYKVEEIESLLDAADATSLARLDILLTDGILCFLHDLSEGRSKARRAFPRLFAEAGNDDFDPFAAISYMTSVVHLRDYLASLGPQHSYYRQLRDALADYRIIAEKGGWPEIPDGKTLHAGADDPRLPAIRQLLFTVGDLVTESAQGILYDPVTLQAVKQFQFRHGLEPDGVIGKGTLGVMNVSVERRIEQIEVNLERWRWHDHGLGKKYVLVNIAGFDLKAVEDGRIQLEMPVIVGKLHHESPVFSDRIRYAEFNPFWNLTPHIARTETLAHLRKDPGYLAAKHIRLFSSWQSDGVELDPYKIDWHKTSKKTMSRYKLRQDSGKWNALGTMKFVFPNKYSVYMHDTPNHELFKKAERAFSHGCIRLSDPPALAVFLMGGQENDWNIDRVDEIVKSSKRTVIRLPEKVPVHLTYLTGWHDADSLLHFNKDLYHRDKRLSKALENIP